MPGGSQPRRAGASLRAPETTRRVLRASRQFLFTLAPSLEYGILEQEDFRAEVLKAKPWSCKGLCTYDDKPSGVTLVPGHLTYRVPAQTCRGGNPSSKS